MQLSELYRRLGLRGEPADPRFAAAIVLAALLLYVIAFAFTYPSVVTNDDEAAYIDHARIFADGSSTIPKLDPLTGEYKVYRTDYYPIGTALTMAPFVEAFGWQGAYLSPLLGLLASVLLLARWLWDEGRSPLFALLALAFPACLVLGRVGMSDVPSVAMVTFGLWLFWRGIDGHWSYWLASGFVASLSLMFRDTNAVLFTPLFLGSVIRRERACLALIAGGLAGLVIKFGTAYMAFDVVLYSRSDYIPELLTMGGRLSIYLVGLMVFIPGGVLLGLLYRGRRWPEVRAMIVVFVLFFAIQKHTTYASEWSKRLILDWRYMLPVVPVIIFGMAESAPRLWSSWLERLGPASRRTWESLAGAVLLIGVGAIATAGIAVHVAFDRWGAVQGEMRDAIHRHTGDDSVVITNELATRKLLRNIERHYHYLDRDAVDPADVADLVERYGEVFLVFLDRTETDWRMLDVRANERFVESLADRGSLEFDEKMTDVERLRIWRLTGPGGAASTGEARPPQAL